MERVVLIATLIALAVGLVGLQRLVRRSFVQLKPGGGNGRNSERQTIDKS